MNHFQKQISESISWLRFPLVLMVVFIHSSGFGEFQTDSFNFSALADISLYDFLRILVSRILCQVAVPLFFIISGYLFYTKFDIQSWSWEIWIKKIKTRTYTLLIPYLSWNILRFVYDEGLWLLQSIRHGESISTSVCLILSKISPKIFFNYGYTDTGYINWNHELTMMSVPAHTPFWYVRDLIVLVIMSPLIYFLLKRLMGGQILILLAIYIAMPFDNIDIRGLVFFSIGGYIQLFFQKNRTENVKVSSSLCGLGMGLFLLLSFINVFYRSILPITVLIGISAVILLSLKLSSRIKINEQLSKSSFFIFAFHMFLVVMVNTLYGMSHLEIYNEFVLLLLYLVLPIVYCILSYFAYRLICKNRHLSLLLLGKRS